MVSGGVITPTQRPLPDNHNNHEAYIHALGKIRTGNPSKRAVPNHALELAATGIGCVDKSLYQNDNYKWCYFVRLF
jgi:hypothetical protein